MSMTAPLNSLSASLREGERAGVRWWVVGGLGVEITLNFVYKVFLAQG